MHQETVGKLPKARYAFVDGMVVFDVVALEVFPALPPVVEPDGEDPDVVGRAFADQEGIARNAAGLVNEGRGGRPAGIVKHGAVQRRQDPRKRVLVAHGDSSFAVMSEPPVLDGAVQFSGADIADPRRRRGSLP